MNVIGGLQGSPGSLGGPARTAMGVQGSSDGCAICGAVLPAERGDFCSEPCRQRAANDLRDDLADEE